ncbi:hypothetical protein LU293_08160 [Moraxella nasovis]|uniref:hypothetical protein n=1 Tax=Moraxella nasovis TaxID=2904121 RepID=UPI001F621C9E|nr:hypothetical protein [Moraxella nasovis]UNU73045.1 hypothetical protein LU293_08160 [Moraxella nasovis]
MMRFNGDKIEKFVKFLSIILVLVAVLLIGVVFIFNNANSKDLVKKGLVKNVAIKNDDLIFTIEKDYASGLDIGYDSKTVYSKDFGYPISAVSIDDYQDVLDDKKIYHFMLYHYDLGGQQFSGFDFCVNGNQIYYGKKLMDCMG